MDHHRQELVLIDVLDIGQVERLEEPGIALEAVGAFAPALLEPAVEPDDPRVAAELESGRAAPAAVIGGEAGELRDFLAESEVAAVILPAVPAVEHDPRTRDPSWRGLQRSSACHFPDLPLADWASSTGLARTAKAQKIKAERMFVALGTGSVT